MVSAAAQAVKSGGLPTFNVRFSEKEYDETWAAVAVAKHIGSCHHTLDIEDIRGTWDHVTGLLLHAGQPFADTSLFAVNAVCRLMRRHVTVALSGDGGDEGFGGYDSYWQLARIAAGKRLPVQWSGEWLSYHSSRCLPWALILGACLSGLETLLVLTKRPHGACSAGYAKKNTEIFAGTRMFFPIRRLFEPQWEYALPPRASRLDASPPCDGVAPFDLA